MCNASPRYKHVYSAATMYSSFSPTLVRPNLPLRKPSSSPMPLGAAPSVRPLMTPKSAPVRPESWAIGNGTTSSPVSGDTTSVLSGATSVHFCNYCGQQGNLRCKRCKKTTYCSVACQTQDWKAHRHMCKSIDPEPAKQAEKESTSPMTVDGAALLEPKPCDVTRLQRVYLKDLSMTKVMKGTNIEASVVEFYNPGRFFVLAQSPEVLKSMQSISVQLQKTYSCPSTTTYVPCVGEVCGVRFSFDRNWYRGLVQTLAADQKTANILYIDFGNEEDVPVDRIKPLAADIQPFCPCAMECRVASVVPEGDNWSGQCCIAVRQLLAGKTVTVKLVETPVNGRIHAVDILLSMGKLLSTYLIEHGYAAEETVSDPPTEQEMHAMASASMENFRCLSDGKDDNTWAQPPEPLTQAVGDSFSVVVTHLQSPSEIVVQKVENAGVIQKLQLKLREHCSEVPAPQNFRPAPGTICCAQFSEDNQWYRAKVLAYSSEERVCVGYLDFGNSEEVDLIRLHPISRSLLALPMQAMPCGLAGVQPVGEKWSEYCVLSLQRRVSNRILRIEICGAHEGKALVVMIDEASDPQDNVAELLTSAGFSVPAPVPASSDQQAQTGSEPEPHVTTPASEPLVWSRAELPCGQTVALLTSAVENPGEFFCHVDNPADRQRLIELGAELNRHCEGNVSPFTPKVGEPCCAMSPVDGQWYRVMVNELSEDEASVNLADYGYSMTLEKKHLRSITPRLLTLPFQAIHCNLTGVEPLGSEWSSEALLCFQTLAGGKQLSARVLSVSERGYDVKLDSKGHDVAAALISEQLAKAPGSIPKVTQANTGSGAQQQETVVENEHIKASKNTTASSKEMPPEATSFPADWKTVELPLNETFEPCIAAVISPSLFYVVGPNQVDQQKLQGVMMELAAYCSKKQASAPSAAISPPVPGAACCAKFSADNNWYRAVVLEVGDDEMKVLYADYGNTEKVPFSSVLLIPERLLQLPFPIARCALGGKEPFPKEWPKEAQHIFQGLLQNGVLATVQSFDGSANLVSFRLPTEQGGGHLSTMILDALQSQAKSVPCPSATQKAEHPDSRTSAAGAAVEPDCLQPKSVPEIQTGKKNTKPANDQVKTPAPAPWTPQQRGNTSVNEDPVQKIVDQMEPLCTLQPKKDPQTSCCSCLSLNTKIDHLEQLVQLQLSLIAQLVGQKK